MDDCRFERLTRQLANSLDRRDTLRIVGAALIASVPLLGPLPEPTLAGQLTKGCRNVGQRCRRDEDCCGNSHCAGHRCKCVAKGKSCMVLLDPDTGFSVPQKALCCSADCSRKHKCK